MLIKIMHIMVRVHFGLGCILVWGAIRVGVKLRLGRILHKWDKGQGDMRVEAGL